MVEPTPEEIKEQITEETEDIMTPFEIKATSDKGIDYDKLIEKYGCSAMTPEIIKRIEDLTGKPVHRFIRRGIFFCQRDLDEILNCYQKEKPFYLYTGRGPSADALHMGHTIPFLFTKYL
jgi:tryptophanyl-tRNA synthetase